MSLAPVISRTLRTALALAAVIGALACAPVPKPHVMSQVEAARTGAAAAEARTQAPAAFAHAEKLRADALEAWNRGDHSAAQVIAEQAIAAYAHALAYARIARAERSASAAEVSVGKSQGELRGIEEEQTRLAAEADALEMRIKVARDAVPVVPSGPADAARDKARLAAARALVLQARLLCGGARMLVARTPPSAVDPKEKPVAAAPNADLEGATASVTKIEAELARGKGPAPIDEAMRARAACLSALTAIRRAGTPVSRAPGAGDALLAELSATGKFGPSRDDRGVFVTLRDVFRSAALTSDGEAKLAELGRVGVAHPAFPVLVVVHADRDASAQDQSRADAAVRALKAAGATSVDAVLAGAAAPLVDPAGRDHARNARLEVVFVTPETF